MSELVVWDMLFRKVHELRLLSQFNEVVTTSEKYNLPLITRVLYEPPALKGN